MSALFSLYMRIICLIFETILSNLLIISFFSPLSSVTVRLFRKGKGTGAEMCPAIVSGIVTGEVPVSYWPNFSPVSDNSPRSLCESELEPVSLSLLKWRMRSN